MNDENSLKMKIINKNSTVKNTIDVDNNYNVFNSFFENNSAIMLQIEVETKNIVNVNHPAISFYGYSKEEFLKKTIYDIQILPKEDVNLLMNQTLLKKSENFEFQHKTADNTVKDVRVFASPVNINNVLYVIIMVNDISQQKAYESTLMDLLEKSENNEMLYHQKNKELQEKNIITQTILDNLPIGLALNKINEGEATYMNKKFEEIYGWSSAEITSFDKFFENVYPNPDYRSEIMGKIMGDIMSGDKERMHWENIEITRKDSSKRIVNAVNIPLAEQNLMVLTVMDITELHLINKELKIAKEKAEESDRLKTAFLANISHEIRTPMNGILGFAELLKEPKLSGEEQQNFISIIEKSGKRMLNIINDLINISKVESGQMEIVNTETDINEQIDFLYNFFNLEAIQKGIKLKRKYSNPDNHIIIITDREKIYAILTNLIKNAIKFTKEGEIEIGFDLKEETLEFFVTDTGIGISEENQKSVFERFVQADNSLSREYEGAGLGLSISKAYVEMLGGKIWLESKLGEGTKFHFTLPAKFPDKKINQNVNDTNSIKPEENHHKETILIVDDDYESLMLLNVLLRKSSYKLVVAKTGNDAIETCKKNKNIKLILMDIKMPIMDGYTAALKIKELFPELPIIAQTAFATEYDIEKYSNIFDDYITKPIDTNKLLTILKSNLKDKR